MTAKIYQFPTRANYHDCLWECGACEEPVRENDTKCSRCGLNFASTRDPHRLSTRLAAPLPPDWGEA